LGYETQFVVSSNKIITVDKKIKGRGGERERERDEVPCKFCLVIFDQKQKVRDFDASPYYYCLMKKIDLIINFTSHFRG
jgi:uncharacterized protein (DUF1330 family)